MTAPLENNASYVAASETIREKRHRLRRTSGYILDGERVNGCGRKRHSQTVDLHRTAKGAHFVGVETCGSVWHCPVCAARIAEQRREEVAQAIGGAQNAGGAAYMLTLTMRHNRRDKLGYLKSAIADGWRKAQNRRAYRTFKARFGITGTIRAIEVTHGNANGWHPHLHILFITKRAFDNDQIAEAQAILFELWSNVLTSLTERYVALDALDFRPASTSDYVTKWGADRELVKGQQKEGKGSLSPWQLLEAFSRGNKRAGKLFEEYARTFKGARQLTWSKGLKARFGIGEVSDEEAATAGTEAAQDTTPGTEIKEGRIGVLDRKAFDAVARQHLTARVLNVAHAEGWQGVLTFLHAHGIEPTMPDSGEWQQPPSPEKKSAARSPHPRISRGMIKEAIVEAKYAKLKEFLEPTGSTPCTGTSAGTASHHTTSIATGTGKPRCASH
ncbi:protein rep [Kordiimonas sp.]|uniref:protein rep n=1 Tax=Kordiimonas sp. TaxID=1970157 RepID=UPI003B52D007